MFDIVNSSVCYQNVKRKPKFGPYHGPRCKLIICFFMNFSICLIWLTLVCVIKMLRENLSLAHIIALVVLCQLFTFKNVWF